jgi:hypothetical protein
MFVNDPFAGSAILIDAVMGLLPTLTPPSGLVIRTYPGSAIPLVVIKLFENVAIPVE